METALNRGDDWGNEVAGRLSGITDLVAEEALYHLKCRTLFEHRSQTSKVQFVGCLCNPFDAIESIPSQIHSN